MISGAGGLDIVVNGSFESSDFRRNPFAPEAVVFTVSGGELGTDNNEAAELLGAKRSFLKPFRIEELLEAVRKEMVEKTAVFSS